jgi:imidazolonepropionase
MSSWLITHIRTLVNTRTENELLRGKALSVLPSIDNAFLLVKDGRIDSYGPMDDWTGQPVDHVYNAQGQLVLPAWCDSHTHLVFAATREEEFIDKINGLSYAEIAQKGGGILNSARRLNEMPEEELEEQSWNRLTDLIRMGTGAIEIKSGYGLTLEGELKMLRVIRKLKQRSPIPVRASFLGAHAFPLEFKDDHEGYIKLIIEEMLPAIAKEGLADYIDAFCEKGFFSNEDTNRIIMAGKKYGLQAKIHANQLSATGAVETAVKAGALSVDHLENMNEEAIKALGGSSTIGTILPGAAFFLRMNYPPVRELISANAAIALASDLNPGSCPSGNMNLVVALACIQCRILPEEAINAATLNGAWAMGLENEVGSITIGKKANLIFTKPMSSIRSIPYLFGTDPIDRVMINGEFFS